MSTEARAEARKQLRWGHFSAGNQDTCTYCPRCRERVDYRWSPPDKYRGDEGLETVLAAHLDGDCFSDGGAA